MPDQPLATVVYFHMGDSPLRTLLQDSAVPLSRAMYGQMNILLKHDVGSSRKAERLADVVLPPTRENLVQALRNLDGYQVDLFIFTHGHRGGISSSRGGPGTKRPLEGDWLVEQLPGYDSLRMVYSIACYGESMLETWRELGAVAAVGTKGVNFMPHRFRGFVRRWRRGYHFGEAVDRSDTQAARLAVGAFLRADSARGGWGRTSFRSVMGRNPNAESYFRAIWDDDWVDGESGRERVARSSEQVVLGDRFIRRW